MAITVCCVQKKMYLILFLRVANIIAEFNNFTVYADLFEDKSLPCTSNVFPRWRKDGILLSDGTEITDDVKFHNRLRIANNSALKTYNLQIKNISLHDYGLYVCEVQRQSKPEIVQEVLLQKSESSQHDTDDIFNTGTSGKSAESSTSGALTAVFVIMSLVSVGGIIVFINRRKFSPVTIVIDEK